MPVELLVKLAPHPANSSELQRQNNASAAGRGERQGHLLGCVLLKIVSRAVSVPGRKSADLSAAPAITNGKPDDTSADGNEGWIESQVSTIFITSIGPQAMIPLHKKTSQGESKPGQQARITRRSPYQPNASEVTLERWTSRVAFTI